MIGVFNDSNDNNYTSPTTQTTENNAPQQKVYTDKEKQADLKAYKDSLLYNLNSRWILQIYSAMKLNLLKNKR